MALAEEYFRRDQRSGITAPDLTKDWTILEHIVRARGKRSQFTSVSLDPAKIEKFGPTLYRLLRESLADDAHDLLEHQALIDELRRLATDENRRARNLAVQALRYARSNREGLTRWAFSIENVPRKDAIRWAFRQVQRYFERA